MDLYYDLTDLLTDSCFGIARFDVLMMSMRLTYLGQHRESTAVFCEAMVGLGTFFYPSATEEEGR